MSDQPFDPNEPSDVKKRTTKARQDQNTRLDAVAAIMSQPATRKWMWGLLDQAHVFKTSFSNNTSVMAFNEGERNIGLQLLADVMKASPSDYLLMIKENAA